MKKQFDFRNVPLLKRARKEGSSQKTRPTGSPPCPPHDSSQESWKTKINVNYVMAILTHLCVYTQTHARTHIQSHPQTHTHKNMVFLFQTMNMTISLKK